MFTQTTQPQMKSCHLSNSHVVVTIKETSWGGSKKYEDIAFENTQTFSVLNSKIQLVPFNDCRWEESVEKVIFNFNQGNAINISRSIRRCKKPSIFENFLESFFWSNYRLTVQSSNCTKMIPPRMLSWKSSAWTVPSIFEYFSRK